MFCFNFQLAFQSFSIISIPQKSENVLSSKHEGIFIFSGQTVTTAKEIARGLQAIEAVRFITYNQDYIIVHNIIKLCHY